jgi:hypothetical protein
MMKLAVIVAWIAIAFSTCAQAGYHQHRHVHIQRHAGIPLPKPRPDTVAWAIPRDTQHLIVIRLYWLGVQLASEDEFYRR